MREIDPKGEKKRWMSLAVDVREIFMIQTDFAGSSTGSVVRYDEDGACSSGFSTARVIYCRTHYKVRRRTSVPEEPSTVPELA